VRILFFVLLFANLAYLAWAGWVDVPQPAPVNEAYTKLPRLKLVGETASPVQPAPGQSAPSPAAPNASDSARKTSLVDPARAARCLSIGPFANESDATASAAKLRERGLRPRQRSAGGELTKGFWVYIGGLKSDREVAQVLRVLEQSHVDDAHAMPPESSDDRRVSVGLFSERDRADKRAQSLRKLNLQPEVAARTVPGTVFWMDVDLPPGAAAPSVGDFAAGQASGSGSGSSIQAVSCPGSTMPAATPLAPAHDSATFRTKVATGTPKMP
jgi:SPOR domain